MTAPSREPMTSSAQPPQPIRRSAPWASESVLVESASGTRVEAPLPPRPSEIATVEVSPLGYELLPSDPRRLGALDIVRRLKRDGDIAHAARPVPFLALGKRLATDKHPTELVVKVSAAPPSEIQLTGAADQRRLRARSPAPGG